MPQTAISTASSLTDRWPTGLALVSSAGAVTVIALLDRRAEFFGPAVATMAGIYLVTYAIGRPWTAWPAFVGLSALVSALHLLRQLSVLTVDPGIIMTSLLVPLWCWTVARRRFADVRTFSVQTVGMLGFGAIALGCAVTRPQLGTVLAGAGFLVHGLWDACHFVTNRVVSRPWSEFCGVVDLVVGTALIIAASG